MKIASLPSKFKRILFLLRKKGIGYTFNYIHFSLLFAAKNLVLLKLLYWLEPYPSYLEVEVSTRCNLRCIMCERTYWQEENKDMTLEQFKYIIDQFPKLKWIGLTGIGESFLNKDFLEMVKYVKEKNVFVELYDNFFLVDERTSRELIKMGIDKFYISLDAATKEIYEKLRVGSNFERVINNLKKFFQLKKEMKADFPQVAFHFVVNKLNVREIPRYIDLAYSIGEKENLDIQFSRMLHSFKETEELFTEIPEEVIKKAEDKAKELGIKVVFNADVPQVKPSMKKCAEWTMPFIFVSGHVIPCCAGNEAGNREFQKRTALGNIFSEPFKEIWRGEKYKNLRRMLNRGQVPLPCGACPLYQRGKEA